MSKMAKKSTNVFTCGCACIVVGHEGETTKATSPFSRVASLFGRKNKSGKAQLSY